MRAAIRAAEAEADTSNKSSSVRRPALASSAKGGLISTASAKSLIHRDLIIRLAAQYKLPAVFQERSYVAAVGLTSYGPNFLDQFRREAGYVDRILKGEKQDDPPVQAAYKYDVVVN